MKRITAYLVFAATLLALPTVAQAPTFPWPSSHVAGGVRDAIDRDPDGAFALLTTALEEMNASPNAAVRTVGTTLRDRLAVFAGLIDQGGDVASVQVYKQDFERIMAIVGGRATEESTDAIRAGFLQVLQAEFEPKP